MAQRGEGGEGQERPGVSGRTMWKSDGLAAPPPVTETVRRVVRSTRDALATAPRRRRRAARMVC